MHNPVVKWEDRRSQFSASITTRISGLMVHPIPVLPGISFFPCGKALLHMRSIFVFTYCHVDGSPIWDGSSATPRSAVTSSCHLWGDITRGKHFTERKPVKYGIFTCMFGEILQGACLCGYLNISSVFHDTVIPDVAFESSSSPALSV